MAANDALAGRDLAALEAEEPSEAELLAMEEPDLGEDDEGTGETGEQPDEVEEVELPEEGTAEPGDDAPAEADEEAEPSGQPPATTGKPTGKGTPTKTGTKPEQPLVPVRFRVAGRDHELADSMVIDRGDEGQFYVIKADTFKRKVQPMLGDPQERIAREQHFKRLLAEKDHDPARIVSQVYSAKMDEILDALQKGDREPFERFMENPDASVRELRLAAREAVHESGQKLNETIAAIDSEPEEERRITEQFQSTLFQGIQQVLEEPTYKRLRLNAPDLFERFWEVRGRLFPVATREYCPPGIQLGDRFLDLRYLRALLDPASAVASRVAVTEPAKGRTKALNAAAAGSRPAAKVTTRQAEPVRKPREIKSKEDWNRLIAEEARRP